VCVCVCVCVCAVMSDKDISSDQLDDSMCAPGE